MLGIFQTKKAEYNKLILKSLVTGPKTTKQIAEYIYFNRKQKPKLRLHPKRTKEPNENEVKKVVSIISRKDSRLDELGDKDYIFRENNLWYPTKKGSCVAFTLFNSMREVFPHVRVDLPLKIVEEEFYKIPAIRTLMKYYPDKQKIQRIFAFGKSPQVLQLWKDYTNELIAQGVDLDKMSDREFELLMINKGMDYFFSSEIDNLRKAILEEAEKSAGV